jgi:hypothetical protein
LDHADETYFLSRALAKKYDLDPTTIVRTVQALGCKRYGKFAAELRSHFVARITPYALMKSAVRDKRSVAHHIEHTLEMVCYETYKYRHTIGTLHLVNNRILCRGQESGLDDPPLVDIVRSRRVVPRADRLHANQKIISAINAGCRAHMQNHGTCRGWPLPNLWMLWLCLSGWRQI